MEVILRLSGEEEEIKALIRHMRFLTENGEFEVYVEKLENVLILEDSEGELND